MLHINADDAKLADSACGLEKPIYQSSIVSDDNGCIAMRRSTPGSIKNYAGIKTDHSMKINDVDQ
jgi:hypothetical protein